MIWWSSAKTTCLGRVLNLHSGRDSHVRVMDLKTWNNYSTNCETGNSPYMFNFNYLIASAKGIMVSANRYKQGDNNKKMECCVCLKTTHCDSAKGSRGKTIKRE